jgi:hypothetical protein
VTPSAAAKKRSVPQRGGGGNKISNMAKVECDLGYDEARSVGQRKRPRVGYAYQAPSPEEVACMGGAYGEVGATGPSAAEPLLELLTLSSAEVQAATGARGGAAGAAAAPDDPSAVVAATGAPAIAATSCGATLAAAPLGTAGPGAPALDTAVPATAARATQMQVKMEVSWDSAATTWPAKCYASTKTMSHLHALAVYVDHKRACKQTIVRRDNDGKA